MLPAQLELVTTAVYEKVVEVPETNIEKGQRWDSKEDGINTAARKFVSFNATTSCSHGETCLLVDGPKPPLMQHPRPEYERRAKKKQEDESKADTEVPFYREGSPERRRFRFELEERLNSFSLSSNLFSQSGTIKSRSPRRFFFLLVRILKSGSFLQSVFRSSKRPFCRRMSTWSISS